MVMVKTPLTVKVTNLRAASRRVLTNLKKVLNLIQRVFHIITPNFDYLKKEYGKVIRAIDDLYASKYEGKSKGWLTLSKETYKFEIHGFNEYNIYEKRKG